MKHLLKGVWKLVLLFFLIILAFSYAMFQGGFVSWFLFYSFLPFAIYALALSFYPIRQLEAVRHLPKHEYTAGETMAVTLEMKRKSAFPLILLIIEDRLSQRLETAGVKKAKTILFPGFQKGVKINYEVKNLPRGEHVIPSVRVKTGDLLGLVEKEAMLEAGERIIVYPAYEEMIYRPFKNHYDQGMTASRERVQRDTTMAIGIREYQPGDRFSWINWKATARRNDIMTKEFEQRQSHDVYIIMDCAADSRFEIVVSFTASMARAILRQGAQVGFLSSSAERVEFPIRGGEAQQQQIFHHLAKVEGNSKASIEKVLEAERFLSQQNFNLMLVTANLSKALIEKISFFASRKGNCAIFLMKSKGELANELEVTLKDTAAARGICVVMVHEGMFAAAFSEVRKP